MKIFKNKKIIVIFILLVTVSITLYFALNKKEEPANPMLPENKLVTKETMTLKSPRNLSIVNNILTWQEIENATSYLVTIDGKEYLTNANMFNLSDANEEKGYVKVKALSSNNNLSSINSIERYYLKEIDENEVQNLILKIRELLFNYYKLEIDEHLENVIELISYELYKEGVNSVSYENYYSKFQELILNFEQEEIDSNKFIVDLYNIFNNELSDFANVLILKNVIVLNLECYKKINSFDKRFDLLIEELNNIGFEDIEIVSLTIRYLRDLSSVMYEQGNTIIEQFKMAIENDVKSTNSIDLGYDMLVLKNQITSNFILEIPTVEEYEFAVNVLISLYDAILPEDLQEYNLVELFRSEFYSFYLEQHQMVYYLDYFNNTHYEKLLPILKNLYSAFGGQMFENNIIELESYYHDGKFDEFLENLLKYGLTTEGTLDQNAYDKALVGLKQLNIDLQNEDYQYLEGPLTTFFTELFNYFKVEHSASIIVNPLINYLKEGGSFSDHFKAQFNIFNYIKIAEDKTYIDFYQVIKDWDKSDWESINNFDGDLTELRVLIDELGLQDIIVVNDETLNDLLEMRFIIHLISVLDELSLKESMTDKITFIFDHFGIFTIIMPLVQNLLVDLDYRYGTNIDIMNFLMNVFVNMGSNPTMVILNLSELNTFINSFESSFDYDYVRPDLIIEETDSESIKIAVKENLIYLLFGNEFDNLLEFVLSQNQDFNQILDLFEKIRNENETDNPSFGDIIDSVFDDQILDNFSDFENIFDSILNNQIPDNNVNFNDILNNPNLEDWLNNFIGFQNSNNDDNVLSNLQRPDRFIPDNEMFIKPELLDKFERSEIEQKPIDFEDLKENFDEESLKKEK